MAFLARSTRSTLRFLSLAQKTAMQRGYAAEANQMDFTFAASNLVFYNKQHVRQVDVPSFSGAFGILPNHVPTLAVLKPGVVTVYEDGGDTKRFFVSSGSVTINDDSSVQIIAEEAVPVDNLDINAAREVLSRAQSELSSASSEEDKAEAAIAVEVGEALVKACE